MNKQNSRRILAAISLLVIVAAACGRGTATPSPTPTPHPPYVPPPPGTVSPLVIQRTPERGEELALDGAIELIFDRPMDRASVEAAFSISSGVAGSFEWKDDQTVRFKPAAELERDATYEVYLGAEAHDLEGQPLDGAFYFQFRTVGYLEVSQVIPAPDTAETEATSTITVMFNRPVVPLLAVSDPAYDGLPDPVTFDPPIAGSGEWLNTSIYVFTPAGPLAGGTTYNACVAAGLADTTGGLLAEDYRWSFSTQPPQVVWVQPYDDAELVPVNTRIQATFNMPVDPASAQSRFSVRPAGTRQPVDGDFRVLDNTILFIPTTWLDFDREYVVTIDAGVASASGGAGMKDDYTWRFTTVPLPRIIATDPGDGERDAHPYTAFEIIFNTPVDPRTVMPNVEMTPPLSPTLVYTYFRYWDNSFVIGFGAQPSSDYQVRIGPDIADPYGNTTGQQMTVNFRTAALDPTAWLHVPGSVGTYSAYEDARLFVAFRNTDRIDLALYRLTLADCFGAMDDWYNFSPPSGSRQREWSLDVAAPLNELRYTPVELAAGGGPLEAGIYLLDLDAAGVAHNRWQHRHLFVVSQVNLTLKSSAQETLVWATDLDSGAPVSGLQLTGYDAWGAAYHSATTDGEGLATLPGHGPDGWYGLTVAGDSPFTLGRSDWINGVSPWEFGFETGYPEEWRAHVYTDRPIYRPAQTVYFRGVIRAEDDARYSMPGSGSVQVTVYDAAWELIYEENLPLDAFGAFTGELELAEGAALGQYGINARFGDREFYASFQVAAYRPPEFEVTVTPERAELARGEENRAVVDVRYFFGGPVSNRPVEWNVLVETHRFRPDGFGRYSFADDDDPWSCWDCWWWYPYDEREVVLSGSGTTDAAGQLVIDLPADLAELTDDPAEETPLGGRTFIVEATVYGSDGQVLSGRSEVVVHPGDFYIGLLAREYVGQAGDEMAVDVVTVDWEGQRRPGIDLDYTVYRREWANIFVANETGGGRWEWETNDIEVDRGTLTTDELAEGTITFVPPEGGSYKVVVSGRDSRERLVQSSLFLWASGSEYVSWRRSNDDRFSLISDKATYSPGETAEILIPSPFQGEHWALVTVERGTILQQEIVRLVSNSTVYRLPITADHVPNVYVSVVVMQGRLDAIAAGDGAPATASYKVGYVALAVEPEPQTLRIELTPSVEQAEPGAQVTYDVRVTDATGEPVSAALSLDLVDKAILTLRPRAADAIVSAFYGRRGLGVTTASGLALSINRLLLEQVEDIDDDMFYSAEDGVGGGGMEEGAISPTAPSAEPMMERSAVPGGLGAQLPAGVELREEFADTAYWNGAVVTADDGTAQVTVDLPDNLTTWVLRGVGITQATEVGEATAELLVTKPLLVRPVTPRFFVVGDRVQLAAIVNNNSGGRRTVDVTIAYTGLALDGPATQQVNVPSGGEVRVTWWVTVEDDPQVELAFSAVADDLSDAARPRLTTGPEGAIPVYRYTAPEVVGTGGQLVEEDSRTEVVALPPRYDDRRGELAIRIDHSLAAAMTDGLGYLEHFEYECTEQTVSRFLPNVLTYRALQELGLSDPELEARLPGLVEEGLSRLYLQQHADGGWGWWWDDESNPYLTAYVVFALDKTAEAGFSIHRDVLERGLDFLASHLVTARELDTYREANRQAWLLYVLAEAGRTGAASEHTGDLFDNRIKLNHYGRAYLALTLDRIDPDDARIQTLLSDLQNAAILSATGAHWEEQNCDWWAMNTDTRSSAVILDALIQLDPNNALIPNVVRWLMVARQDGIWETTQETAWALIALTDWMAVTGELEGRYDYGLHLNDSLLVSDSVTPETVRESVQLSVDVADLLAEAGNRLTVGRGPGEGRLYYTAHLRVYLPVEEIEPLERGIIVQRQYVATGCADGEICEQVDSIAVGDTVQVRLTIIAPHDLYYVVVEDPLPAGAEAVDTSLATTSLLEQDPSLYRETGEEFWRPFYWWWWRWYSRSEMRDEKVVLFADYLPAGTYTYQYTFRATHPGEYHVIPTTASEFYFPEVYGRADGRLFTVTEE
ncbi:MAG: Ig-like domain-containing protein [Anaerolineae bacterium]|nr:Ig-like domain-containing protein [Anaerolineae bacterium]